MIVADPKQLSEVCCSMADPNERIHVETDEARAGATPHMTRYILPASLILVIAIFAWIVLG